MISRRLGTANLVPRLPRHSSSVGMRQCSLGISYSSLGTRQTYAECYAIASTASECSTVLDCVIPLLYMRDITDNKKSV